MSGSGFGASQGSSTVKFNGTAATASSWSAASITVTVPTSATTGSVVVRVSNSNSNGVTFTVVAAPTLTTVSPTSGPVGAVITLTGSNFSSSGTVTVGNVTAATSNWSTGSITATVPPNAVTGNVIVNASGVNSGSKAFSVTPAITSLSVMSGAVGASVIITGTSFGTLPGTSTVKFGAVAATVTNWTPSALTTTVPATATSGSVVVRVGGFDSNAIAFTVAPPPILTAISPSTAAVGALVTVSGTNLGSSQGGSLRFGSTVGTPTAWNASTIAVPVPTGATTGPVTVRASGVDSNGLSFTVVPPPVITSVAPAGGPVGTPVVITGNNFGAIQGSGVVRFNTVTASVVSWSDTRIAVAVPATAATGSVTVTASGVASNGSPFTVGAAPTVTSVLPGSSTIGGVVTIAGSNFGAVRGTGSVRFGDRSASVITWGASSIVAVIPPGAAGEVVVRAGGVNSNRLPVNILTTLDTVAGSASAARVGFSGRVDVTLVRPKRNPAAPRGLDVQLSWYRASQLFAVERFTLSDEAVVPSSVVHGSVATTSAPPWRVVVRAREVLAQVAGGSLTTCNSDRPYAGQAACTDDTLPAPVGPVLGETTSEITIPAP